jgi:hypothetical protein
MLEFLERKRLTAVIDQHGSIPGGRRSLGEELGEGPGSQQPAGKLLRRHDQALITSSAVVIVARNRSA